MSDPKANVPKFASFRPKPAPAPSKAETEPKDCDEERHSSKSRSEHERRPGHHKRRRSQSRKRRHTPPPSRDVVASRAVADDTVWGTFVVDRKGDVKNLVYGSIHQYSVPPYYRFGSGHVLGASLDLRIDRDLDGGKQVVLRDWKTANGGRREKYIFSRAEKERPRLLRIRPEASVEAQEDISADFMSLEATKGRKRKRGESGGDDSSDSDQDSRDYRSIYGKHKDPNKPNDPNLEYVTESDESGSDAGRTIRLDASVRDQNIMLSRKVEENPADINAWLALIAHQDILMKAGDERRKITNAEIRSTADIKIHMYEKALQRTRSLADREALLQGLMAEGTKIWELKTQASRWEQIAKDNIDSLLLWTSFLNFKQYTFSTFRYEEVKELYVSRLKLLLQTVKEAKDTSVYALFEQVLYVLLRFTLFLRESGYLELSLAVWQCLLEFNFCSPDHQTSKDTIELFQGFWDSEVPRIGEDGALGWRQFVTNENSSGVPDPTTDEPHGSLDESRMFKSWAAVERNRSICSRMPARTMDEVIEDDPFRVILFSDIQDFLIPFPTTLRTSCINAFLLFCRLSPLGSNPELSREWCTDQYIRNELIDYSSNKLKRELSQSEGTDSECTGIGALLPILLPNCHETSDMLFASTAFQKLVKLQDQYEGDQGPVPYRLMRNILRQLVQRSFTDDLAQYYLAFEYRNEPESIKKVAKGLLKEHPTSVKLYNAYALIEWSRGNKDVAEGVLAAALSMSKSSSDAVSNADSILLWRSLVWGHFEDGDKNGTLAQLLSIPDGLPNPNIALSPAARLRAKMYIISTRDFLLSSGDLERAVWYTECYTILVYVTSASASEPTSPSQGDISSALDALLTFSDGLHLRSPTHQELLLQSACRLLWHHCSKGPYRPSLVRHYLTTFLTFFPHNTMFLSLYTANESRLRVENRVRSLLLNTVLSPENDCLTSRLFAIQYEIRYGTVHSVKAAFERTVASPVSGSSPGLWRLYLLWAVENKGKLLGDENKKGKAGKDLLKELWYRGLRACPWTKELYVLGLEEFGDEMVVEFDELKGTWKVLGEKELRIHVDLEDEFEAREESRANRNR